MPWYTANTTLMSTWRVIRALVRLYTIEILYVTPKPDEWRVFLICIRVSLLLADALTIPCLTNTICYCRIFPAVWYKDFVWHFLCLLCKTWINWHSTKKKRGKRRKSLYLLLITGNSLPRPRLLVKAQKNQEVIDAQIFLIPSLILHISSQIIIPVLSILLYFPLSSLTIAKPLEKDPAYFHLHGITTLPVLSI